MIQLLQQISFERAMLLVFLAGGLYREFKDARRSLREHGRRIGDVEGRIATVEGKLGISPSAAPEASGTRGG